MTKGLREAPVLVTPENRLVPSLPRNKCGAGVPKTVRRKNINATVVTLALLYTVHKELLLLRLLMAVIEFRRRPNIFFDASLKAWRRFMQHNPAERVHAVRGGVLRSHVIAFERCTNRPYCRGCSMRNLADMCATIEHRACHYIVQHRTSSNARLLFPPPRCTARHVT